MAITVLLVLVATFQIIVTRGLKGVSKEDKGGYMDFEGPRDPSQVDRNHRILFAGARN